MTSKSKTASALIALASVVAGVGMVAIAIRVQTEDRVWNETRNLAQSSPFESPGAGMPFVPPVPPLANVTIGPITYQPKELPVAQAQPIQRPSLKQTCAPYWRELVEGPSGRQVAITCPGGPEPPPPPPSTRRIATLQRLPSLEDLRGGPLPLHAIAGGTPNADEALAAARRVADSMAGRRVVETAPAEPAEELAPATNALGWRACPSQERVASNEPQPGHC